MSKNLYFSFFLYIHFGKNVSFYMCLKLMRHSTNVRIGKYSKSNTDPWFQNSLYP